MYLIAGIGTSLGYHRILTHKSADLPRWLEYTCILIGLPAGTPVQWVGNHRAHHKSTDQIGDPHSPITDGFWYAHCGWYIQSKNRFVCFLYALAGPFRMFIDGVIRPRLNQNYNHLAKDIQKDKFYAFISRPYIYMVLLWFYLANVLLLPYFLFGWWGIFAASITLIIIYNLGDAIDSIGHLIGEKRGQSQARNNTVLGFLAFGDGWHANHHEYPKRAQHGIKKNQLDLTYFLLKTGKLLRIVKKIY